MRVRELNTNKEKLAQAKFVDANGERIWNNTVSFCGETFDLYEPNFCGGSIKMNCKSLDTEEFSVLNTFDTKYLDRLELELAYMTKLIATRRKELEEPKTVITLYCNRYKQGNTKKCRVYVLEEVIAKDTYGDTKVLSSGKIQSYDFSDTKVFQAEINAKIKSLEAELGISCTYEGGH